MSTIEILGAVTGLLCVWLLEPSWPIENPVVHHMRGDGRWYSLSGIDDSGNLLWLRSEESSLFLE